METLRLGIALFLPWLCAGVWLRLRWRDASAGAWAMVLGYGYLIGILATALLLYLEDRAGIGPDFTATALILAALTAAGLWSTRALPWRGRARPTWQRQPMWKRLLFGALLALIALRWGGLLLEVLWRPLYPWDAWTTWAAKARVWFELGELVPFVDAERWLSSREEHAYALDAWHYPPLVPLIQVWMASALGRWDDTLINLPWAFCGMALGLALYGQARLARIEPLPSLAGVYLLLSLPILDTHIALAGYADLWLAACYGLAAMAFYQWARDRDARQGIIALLLALACPLIKLEGTLWLLSFLPALLAVQLPARRLVRIAGGGAAALTVWVLSGGIEIALPGLGTLSLTPNQIDLPYLGASALAFHPVWEPFYRNFFMFANWHLIWYAAPLSLILALPRILAERALLGLTVLLLTACGMLFAIFSLTDNARWAMTYTSLNRTFLQPLPILLFWMLLAYTACVHAQRPTSRTSIGGLRR